MTSSRVLPAQLISCLSEAPNIATCYARGGGLFPDFIEQVTAYVRDMDAMYVISWQYWFRKLADRMPLPVMKPGNEEEFDDGEADCQCAQAAQTPATPASTKKSPKKRPKPQDPGTSEEDEVEQVKPNKSKANQKDNTPTATFESNILPSGYVSRN